MKTIYIKDYNEASFAKLNRSEMYLVHEKQRSQSKGFEELILTEIVWDDAQTLAAMDTFGVTEFVFASGWSSALDFVASALRAGWIVTGPCDLVEIDTRWGEEVRKPINGIVMAKKAA